MGDIDSKDLFDLVKAGPYEVGTNGVERIVMRRDGAGPMGWYDVIYVYSDGLEENRPWRALPAHMTDFWEY